MMRLCSVRARATCAGTLLAIACNGGGSGGDGGPGDGGASCPSDMVYASGTAVCVDKYEASEQLEGEAASAPSANPWVSVTNAEAASGCAAAGKRLCTQEEWEDACQGPSGHTFPYGDTYDPDACNGGVPGAELELTGAMSECEGGYSGLFDMSGNVSEWTQTCSGTNCRHSGGSYIMTETSLRCTSGSTVPQGSTGLVLGFRCCKDPT